MGRPATQHAQVIGRRNNASTKQMMPQTVGDNPGHQRIARIDQLLGQRQSTTPGPLILTFQPPQCPQISPMNFRAGLEMVSANQNRVVDPIPIPHRQGQMRMP